MRTVIAFSTFVAGTLVAQTFPLPATAGDTTPFEATAPFVVPARVTQSLVTSRSALLPNGLPASFINWDMVAFDASSRYVYVPCENFAARAGVFRYDTATGGFATLLLGNGGVRTANPAQWDPSNDEFTAIDPCTRTPWDTILVAEETTGGRLFEVTNPLSPSGPYQVLWHARVPAVAHEGLRFDRDGTLYFIDEDNSGSIYKFVPAVRGDLRRGQTFVLSVDAYAANPGAAPSQTWDAAANRLTTRFGPATWVAMTDAVGNALTIADPFVFVTATGGRTAADELRGTPYGRPEDMDVGRLANGHEVVYVAVTSENRVLAIELVTASAAIVREFVHFDTINLATGRDVNPLQNDPYTSPGPGTVFNNPDNIAVDAFGSVYVIEDAAPGDVWKAVDADKNGVAEAIGLFISLGVNGAEPTGMIFDPNDPYRFLCCIQHPTSGNDALWSFRTRPYPGSGLDLELTTGVERLPNAGPGEFVKSARRGDTLTIAVDSPRGSHYAAPFAVVLQAFPTTAGARQFLPSLWLDPFLPIYPLVGGFAGQFPVVLPFGGSATSVRITQVFEDVSVMVQALVITPVGTLVLTDGHEIVLR